MELFLNGKALALPGKENGLPYYLMDLLQYSGLDLEHLERPVQLTVNGTESSFQQVLRDRDQVTIRYV